MSQLHDDKSPDPGVVTVQISRESLELSERLDQLFTEMGDGDLMVGIARIFCERAVLWQIVREMNLEKFAKKKIKETLIKSRRIASLELSLNKDVDDEAKPSEDQ